MQAGKVRSLRARPERARDRPMAVGGRMCNLGTYPIVRRPPDICRASCRRRTLPSESTESNHSAFRAEGLPHEEPHRKPRRLRMHRTP